MPFRTNVTNVTMASFEVALVSIIHSVQSMSARLTDGTPPKRDDATGTAKSDCRETGVSDGIDGSPRQVVYGISFFAT